jgi:hypothetical protein
MRNPLAGAGGDAPKNQKSAFKSISRLYQIRDFPEIGIAKKKRRQLDFFTKACI